MSERKRRPEETEPGRDPKPPKRAKRAIRQQAEEPLPDKKVSPVRPAQEPPPGDDRAQ